MMKFFKLVVQKLTFVKINIEHYTHDTGNDDRP